MTGRLGGLLLTLALPITIAAGQPGERTVLPVSQPPARGRQGAVSPPPAGQAKIAQQFRQLLARRARVELGLTPEQMTRLQQTDRRFEGQQRDLDIQENQTRKALRQALQEPPSADQDKRVGQLHDRLMSIGRQRFDVMDAEQKELAGFLSNTQRARWHALQENVRQKMREAIGPPPADDAPIATGRPGRPPGR